MIFTHDVRVFPDSSCLVGNSSFQNLMYALCYYTKHKINGVFLYDPTVRIVVSMFGVNNYLTMWLDLSVNIACYIELYMLYSYS